MAVDTVEPTFLTQEEIIIRVLSMRQLDPNITIQKMALALQVSSTYLTRILHKINIIPRRKTIERDIKNVKNGSYSNQESRKYQDKTYKNISLFFPIKYLQLIESLINSGKITYRSEYIRNAIHTFMEKHDIITEAYLKSKEIS